LTLKNVLIKNWSETEEFLLVVNILVGGSLLSLLYKYHPGLLVTFLVPSLILIYLAKKVFKDYSYAGITFYLANLLFIGIGLVWGVQFISTLPISFVSKFLLLATSPLVVLSFPTGIVNMVEKFDILCRTTWNRPRDIRPAPSENYAPFVSLHVPVYAEPAHMVIETLNKLNELNYKNYEVIVIDNNTPDTELWLPVYHHCLKLGKKFKFYHVDELPGAKAGALNYALEKTDPRAKVIGVIDADYHAEMNFIRDLIGHFRSPKIGFVQTPHDYRGWEKNLYLTMCYWEYKIFFHTVLISMNERNATLTVGTMCLIRKEALRRAGGWAEWCVTEDSELAIRIHNAGYSSVYVPKTYGRGLIPETFERYRKQRYRWTAGPVQEFKYHLKHFMGISRKESSFSLLQRIHHFNHGLNNIIIGLSIPLTLLSFGVVASMVMHHEIVGVPYELWLAATIILFSTMLLDWLMYMVTIQPSMTDLIGKFIASRALSHVITLSAFKSLFMGEAKWNRTNKFKAKHSYITALISTKDELFIGLLLMFFIGVSYIALPYTGLVLMFLIGMLYTAMNYLFSPFFSLLNVFIMKREIKQAKSKHKNIGFFSIPHLGFTS
jgi:cellulose synthase/poly-beta-1,6-N-acetylglucosamine synthase-like glycosyltransferase